MAHRLREFTCENCGITFWVRKGPERRFCNGDCARAYMKAHGEYRGTFQPGQRRSPGTEFVKGQRPVNKTGVGSTRIRTEHSGAKRAWVKIAEPNVWRQRAVVVWEAANGPLPRGCVIHHKDRDPLNDVLGNLECLTRAQHLEEHRREFAAKAAAAARRTLLQYHETRRAQALQGVLA